MTTMDLVERSPEELELRIAETRAALEMKIHELERRLSPRERVRRVRARLSPEPYLAPVAAAAVVAGAALAVTGWRRRKSKDAMRAAELAAGPCGC
jgi:hypothetical protein